jgi:hypothetical protein
MAAKKPRKAEKPPEQVIGAVRRGGKVEIDTGELARFLKKLKKKSPKVRFVARNAPFMRQPPVPPV